MNFKKTQGNTSAIIFWMACCMLFGTGVWAQSLQLTPSSLTFGLTNTPPLASLTLSRSTSSGTITVTLNSTNPNYVRLYGGSSVLLVSGVTSTVVYIEGVSPGTADIQASATGYSMGSATITVSAQDVFSFELDPSVVNLSGTNSSLAVNVIRRGSVALNHDATAVLKSGNTNYYTINPTSLLFSATTAFAQTQTVTFAGGPQIGSAQAKVYALNDNRYPTNHSTIVSNVFTSIHQGMDLQDSVAITHLGPPPTKAWITLSEPSTVPVTVYLQNDNPTIFQISDPAQIVFPIGATSNNIEIIGLTNGLGTLRAISTNFATQICTVMVLEAVSSFRVTPTETVIIGPAGTLATAQLLRSSLVPLTNAVTATLVSDNTSIFTPTPTIFFPSTTANAQTTTITFTAGSLEGTAGLTVSAPGHLTNDFTTVVHYNNVYYDTDPSPGSSYVLRTNESQMVTFSINRVPLANLNAPLTLTFTGDSIFNLSQGSIQFNTTEMPQSNSVQITGLTPGNAVWHVASTDQSIWPDMDLSVTVYETVVTNMPPTLSLSQGTNIIRSWPDPAPIIFTVTANEPDADPTMTLLGQNLPATATFTNMMGLSPLISTFSWQPDQIGEWNVLFTAADQNGTTSQYVHISVSSNAVGFLDGLIFSKYIEGQDDRDKAVQIKNLTGRQVYSNEFYFIIHQFTHIPPDMDIYVNYIVPVHHHLANGAVLTVVPSDARQSFIDDFSSDVSLSVNSGNWFDGNDAVTLREGSPLQGVGGPIVDSFGQITYNGRTALSGNVEYWGVLPDVTRDSIMTRNGGVESGSTNATSVFYPSDRWNQWSFASFTNVFQISGLQPGAGNTFIITFNSSQGTIYSVEYNTNLINSLSWSNYISGIVGSNTETSVQINLGSENKVYYRVK